MQVGENLLKLKPTIPNPVTLVAVSKFQPLEKLQEAYDAGQRVFGESRVQELVAKHPLLPADIQWHYIGPLQTNKVKYIAPFIHTIESIDTLKLMEEVDKQAAKLGRNIRVLLEIHVAREETKHGFLIKECEELFQQNAFSAYPHVKIAGLMGMASNTEDENQIRNEFSQLRALFDKVKSSGWADNCFTELSMGMSSDYLIAIECGSTMIRIGSSLFN